MGESRHHRDWGKGVLPREAYDAMVEAYEEQQTVQHVAEKVGVAWQTADRYIHVGDPDRGMPPIAERYRNRHMEQARIQDMSFAERAAQTVDMQEALKTGVFADLMARIYRLCRVCRQSEALCSCEEPDVPPAYDGSIVDFTRLTREQWRWSGGGIFEQQQLGSFMAMAMLVLAKVLREHDLEIHIEPIMEQVGEELKALAEKGIKKAAAEGGGE